MAGQTTRVKDSGANYVDSQPTPKTNPPRSVFDLSYLNILTASEGELLPVGYWEVLPDSDYDFSLQALVRVQPMTVPIMSRMRVFFHAYYLEYSKLWKHWQSFYSKGHSRTYTNTLPSITLSSTLSKFRRSDQITLGDGSSSWTANIDLAGVSFLKPEHAVYPSLIGCIPSRGYRQGFSIARTEINANIAFSDSYHLFRNGFNILGLFAIQHIYRDYYLNQNLHRNDAKWFPDDPHDFVLRDFSSIPGTTELLGFAVLGSGNSYVVDSGVSSAKDLVDLAPQLTVTDSGLTVQDLFTLRYRDWTDDYFTTATPTPVYGNEPKLRLNLQPSLNEVGIPVRAYTGYPAGSAYQPHSAAAGVAVGSTGLAYVNGGPLAIASGVQLSTITLDQLRALAVNQLAIEKMTRTDGSYGEFMRAFFGDVPRTAVSDRAQYIGGCYQPIQISEVLQTSESSDSSPLGEQAGHGISAGDGRIGHLHTTEYGCVVIMMSIMPDTYYAQGQDRWHFADLTQDDYYLSGREQLGPQFIRNREVYDGLQQQGLRVNTPSSGYSPDGVFGYQGLYDHYRYRANQVNGRIGDSAFADYRAYTQARLFNSQPTLSDSFLTTKDNISDDMFVAPDEPHFIVEVANICRAVQPLPYHAIPGSMIH